MEHITIDMDNIDHFIFPGGEVQVKVTQGADAVSIVARIESCTDLMKLMLTVDALKRSYNPILRDLVLGYIPYAQQDRVCAVGEALSIKVFAGMINQLGFETVVSVDPHSDVAPALFDNMEAIKACSVLDVVLDKHSHLYNTTLVSPDAGSNKKMMDICKTFGHKSFLRADKQRDVLMGKITGTQVFGEVKKGAEYTIVDDICVGGRTFVELAKVLKEKGAGHINLYVTHGVFSNGVKYLLDNGIDTVYTTNTRRLSGQDGWLVNEKLHITNII